MQIPAKSEYAIRALLVLASSDGGPLPGTAIAASQNIPAKFLETILAELRRGHLVTSSRGAVGGYRLSRPAAEITLADVIRAVDGPLAQVRGERPEATSYSGPAEQLRDVWVAVRVGLRDVLEETSIADVASKKLPGRVRELLERPGAYEAH